MTQGAAISEGNNSPAGGTRDCRNFLGRFLVWVFALLPPIGIYAPLGVAPFLTVLAVVIACLEPRRCREAIRHGPWWLVALIVIGLWGALSTTWSILPAHSLFEGGRLLTIIASGFVAIVGVGVLSETERRLLARVVAISVIMTISIFLVDLSLHLTLLRHVIAVDPEQVIRLERFDRGTSVLGLVFWPTALGLWASRHRVLLVVLIVAIIAALVVIPSTTNRIAAVVGLGVWLAALWLPRITAGVMAVGVVLFALAMPYAVSQAIPTNETVVSLRHHAPWLKFTALHRLLIWKFTSERIADRPWLGWGMDASRELPGGHLKLIETLSEPVITPAAEALPLHPHNAFLQWRVELGLPATLFCALIVATLLWRSGGASAPASVRATSLACAAASLTIALLGYGVWQAWWMSTLWLAVALFARPSPARL